MRRKGHNFERLIAKKFSNNGFITRTTRATSHLLDSCGVDIVGTPFIIQCKAGYMKRRPKFEEVYRYTRNRLVEELGENHPLSDIPIIAIHQLDVGRGVQRTPEDTYVMISFDDFIKVTEQYHGKILNIL